MRGKIDVKRDIAIELLASSVTVAVVATSRRIGLQHFQSLQSIELHEIHSADSGYRSLSPARSPCGWNDIFFMSLMFVVPDYLLRRLSRGRGSVASWPTVRNASDPLRHLRHSAQPRAHYPSWLLSDSASQGDF